jgi:hypothetical protein
MLVQDSPVRRACDSSVEVRRRRSDNVPDTSLPDCESKRVARRARAPLATRSRRRASSTECRLLDLECRRLAEKQREPSRVAALRKIRDSKRKAGAHDADCAGTRHAEDTAEPMNSHAASDELLALVGYSRRCSTPEFRIHTIPERLLELELSVDQAGAQRGQGVEPRRRLRISIRHQVSPACSRPPNF